VRYFHDASTGNLECATLFAGSQADCHPAGGTAPSQNLLADFSYDGSAILSREVDRYRARRLRAGQFDDSELVDAVERARELHADLAQGRCAARTPPRPHRGHPDR